VVSADGSIVRTRQNETADLHAKKREGHRLTRNRLTDRVGCKLKSGRLKNLNFDIKGKVGIRMFWHHELNLTPFYVFYPTVLVWGHSVRIHVVPSQ